MPRRRLPNRATAGGVQGGAATEQAETSAKATDPTLGEGTLSVAERSALLKYYYNVDNVASLTSSAYKLYKAVKHQHPTLTLDKCRFFLQTQSPYTLTAPRRTYIPRNPMEVYRCFDVLACDIMVLMQFTDANSPQRYCMLVVDVFSRYCWHFMLETRSAAEIVPKFEALLEELRPRLLKTTIYFDRESAIISRQFRQMLKKFDVQLQLSYSETKVSHAEILIRYLKRSLLHVSRVLNIY